MHDICIAIELHTCKATPFLSIEIHHAGWVKIDSTNEGSTTTVEIMDILHLLWVELGDKSPKQLVPRQVSLMVDFLKSS